MTCALAHGQNQPENKKKPEDQVEQYWFVLIKTGPKKDFDSTTRANYFKAIWPTLIDCITMAF